MTIFKIESQSSKFDNNNQNSVDLTLEFSLDKDNNELLISAQTPEQEKTGDYNPFSLDKEETAELISFLQDLYSKLP